MAINSKRTLIASAIVGLALTGAGISQAVGGGRHSASGKSDSVREGGGRSANEGGESTPIVGSDLQHASQVALSFAGGGIVTATELGDEEGYYEIEIGQEGSGQVDVHLDRDFNVIKGSSDG